MTHDEICTLKNRVYDGIKMVVDKAEKVGKEKKEYSMDDLGKMSDVVKDCAEAIKDLAKRITTWQNTAKRSIDDVSLFHRVTC